MNKVGVVILNYLNYNDTIECIDSLFRDKYSNKEIIIVDNGSYNESWGVLYEKYKNNKNIYLLKGDINEGFARGNNLGILFAKDILKCDHILLVNNDTIFKDELMIKKMVEAYDKGIGIIGPTIISSNNMNQNPVLKKVTKYNVKNGLITVSNYINNVNLSIYRRIVNKVQRIFYRYFGQNYKNNSEELVLHGSCLLLTKDYFKYYPYLFPNTFLYYEEDILCLLTKKVGLKKKYINTTYIYHKEDQSSEMSFNNNVDIRNKYLIESMSECLNIFDLSYDEIIKKYFNLTDKRTYEM